MIPALQPLIDFLAATTGDEAKQKWPKGPTVPYRSTPNVPIADYVSWLKRIEDSALGAQSAKQLVQRIRRLYFSSFTFKEKGETANRADALVRQVIPYAEPPLTTDQVPLDVVNGLYGTSTIRAGRAIEVDIGHLWIAVDAMVNGTVAGLASLTNTKPVPLVTWAGDLGSAFREFLREFNRMPEGERTDASGKAVMFKHLRGLASKEDLLGDLDAVVLGTWLQSLDSFVLSREIERYYEGDDKPQSVAKLIVRPKSARRFHWFVNSASEPSIPATGKASLPLTGPLNVTLDEEEMAEDMEDILVEATADVSKRLEIGITSDLERVGRRDFNKLCAKFAEFLKLGLQDGDAPWPPATW